MSETGCEDERMRTNCNLRRDVHDRECSGGMGVVQDEQGNGRSDQQRSRLNEQEDMADVRVGGEWLRHRL